MLARTLYYKIPLRLRWIVSPFILCFRLLRDLKLKVWIVVGEEQNSRKPLSILLYAGNEIYKNYLVGIIFGASYRENYLGRTWLWNIPKKIAHEGQDCSLILIRVIKPLRKLLRTKNCYYIPAWVSGEVDIPCSSSVMNYESLKSDLRRIRRNALVYEVTRETQYFDDFYYNMYVPYITKSHGSSVHVTPYHAMRKEFQDCDLLLIKKQETYIAGILIVYSKSGPRLWRMGIRDGNPQCIKDGAVGALFHFSFKYIEDKGFAKVGLGLSRSFLRDGVLRYKKKLGQRIIDTDSNVIVLRVLKYTPATNGFLVSHPFIFENRGSLYGAVFVDTDKPLSGQDLQRINKDYFHPGLSKLFICFLQQCDKVRQEQVPPELSERIVLCSVEDMLGSM